MVAESIIATCPRCGTKNRIPKYRLHDNAVCGKCRTPLSSAVRYPEHPVDINDQTFRNEVLNFPGGVVVYFWSPSCGYCRGFTPTVNQLASRYAGRIKFTKIVMDRNPAMASQYGIQGVPSLLLFKNGRQIDRLSGAVPQAEVERHLSALL